MKKQAMKAELTSRTRGKFYRESTPGSRIKKAAKKIGKTALNVLTSGLPLEAARTGFKKQSAFKLRSGNKPSIAKLSGIKAATKGAISGGLKKDINKLMNKKDPFYANPKGPEVKDNMPNQKPDPKSIQGGMGLKEFENLLKKQKIDKNRKPPGKVNMLPKTKPMGKMNITRDIKKRK